MKELLKLSILAETLSVSSAKCAYWRPCRARQHRQPTGRKNPLEDPSDDVRRLIFEKAATDLEKSWPRTSTSRATTSGGSRST